LLIDLLMRTSKKNPKELPAAEQVLFSALRMFHDQTAVSEMAEKLQSRRRSLNALSPNFLRRQLPLPLKIE